MNAMRDRSRRHISEGRLVGTHNAQGNKNWAGGNDKVHNVPGILWIDSIVGEWTDFLARRKELDSTLVVFSADHGCIAKGHCFEPGMRVPLFMHGPKLIPKGQARRAEDRGWRRRRRLWWRLARWRAKRLCRHSVARRS